MSHAEKRLYRILKHAKKVSQEGFFSEIAAIGSNICLKVNETGNIFNVILVLPGQEDVRNFKVSVFSSIGVHLFASQKGDCIKYKTGLNSYKIQVLNIKQ